ncbi:PhnD/SsuA/transferrin family substrate-binding protein [bacterium]|nr:PhnD/SsuA/transferrin family substrate-binding protein [bacterium]
MIASLGMYDRAEAQGANDRLWALIRDGLRVRGLGAPAALTRGAAAYWPAWTSDDLTLSQTCGFPYRARLHDKVTLIGTPDYGVAGCPPGYYRSVFVARASDPREDWNEFDGATLAFNEDLSQSGWAAAQNHAARHGIALRPHRRTGGHLLSARAVAEGKAEIAAIDAVTWRMITRWEAFAHDLKVVGQTEPTPGLPYIAARGSDAVTLFDVVARAIAALTPQDRDTLCLRGLVRIPAEAYLAVPTPPTPADLGLREDA